MRSAASATRRSAITCSAANYQVGDAPVSYPYVWNIWKFDWVQYNGSVAQPLARNVGEALGVGAITPLIAATARAAAGRTSAIRSSVDIARPACASNTRCTCCARRAGPRRSSAPIDHDKAARGEALFEQHCQECHGPHVAEAARQQASAPLKPSNGLEWRIEVIPLDHIGTDPDGGAWDSWSGATICRPPGSRMPICRPRCGRCCTRQLLRDVRFRLREVVRLRTESGSCRPVSCPRLLAAYPDPRCRRRRRRFPTQLFAAIDAAHGAR